MEEASGRRAPLWKQEGMGREGKGEGGRGARQKRCMCLAFQLETILSWPSAHKTAVKGGLLDHKIAVPSQGVCPFPLAPSSRT